MLTPAKRLVIPGRPGRRRVGRALHYPHDVLRDQALTLAQKRALLSAWASDAHAVPSLPALRHYPGTPFPVTLSSILDALRMLDRLEGAADPDPPPRPAAAKRIAI